MGFVEHEEVKVGAEGEDVVVDLDAYVALALLKLAIKRVSRRENMEQVTGRK